MPGGPNLGPRRSVRPPRLAVDWESPSVWSNLGALLSGPRAGFGRPLSNYFRHSWVTSQFPGRALVASILLHIAFFVLPFPSFGEMRARPVKRFENVKITWYGMPQDLPPVRPRGKTALPSPPGEPDKPLPRRGADAFHPRQTIISAPVRPNHPRQTLIQPEAPSMPPKVLPDLPNIMQWAEAPQPARPRINISQRDLRRLPKAQQRKVEEVAVPSMPNLEREVGEFNLASSPPIVDRPRLPMGPMSVPRAAPQRRVADVAAPNIAPVAGASGNGLQRIVALSADPAPPVPDIRVPPGNLAATLTIAPEGTQPGAPGGAANGLPENTGSAGGVAGSPGGTGAASGKAPGRRGGGGVSSITGPAGISISGGNPAAASKVSGPAGGTGGSRIGSGIEPRPSPAAKAALPERPMPRLNLSVPDLDGVRPAPGLERIQPGAPPETILGSKRVYTMYVNSPNLSSASGSWVLRFAELAYDASRPIQPGELAAPQATVKVDPRYPPALIEARVEGDVTLYAVIRKNGSVDSIQVLRGLEPQLDRNAIEALAKWVFRPAERNGQPVELEAVVTIPFRLPPRTPF